MEKQQAITELLYRYAWCYDAGEIDAMMDCFSSNGVVRSSVTTVPALEGLAAIRAAMHAGRNRRQAAGEQPRHMIANLIVEPIDGERAAARCYMALIITGADGIARVDHAGRYMDKLANVDGKWKIVERQILIDRDSSVQ